MLANKLKIIICSVIYETQSTFISGRKILDEILVDNEIMDEANKKKKKVILFSSP